MNVDESMNADEKSRSVTSSGSYISSEGKRTDVLIVDHHPAIREALMATISSWEGLQVVGEAATAARALELAERTTPDLVIVDISLQDAHGLDLVRDIREQQPRVRVLVFSMYDEGVYAERAIRAGASGYLMKSEPTRQVAEAIQSISDGDVYLSDRIASRILKKVIRDEDYALGSTTDELTDRELTVFRMLGEGHGMRDIADELGLSRKTIETYRRRAKEKLGFETVSELIQFAVQWAYGRKQRRASEE